MRVFALCVEDDLLAGPQRSVIIATSEGRARILAQRKLDSSPSFSSVNVCEDGLQLFRLERALFGSVPVSRIE
jgi:hypothetical protein